MGRCKSCGSHATYNLKEHRYTCACGNTWLVLPVRKNCYYCGVGYLEYTQGDPSGCEKCHRTFVD